MQFPEKIISGGQAGVDRAALDAALALDVPCGGWCPQGRRAEDGPIPDRYPLQETDTDAYRRRTEWNVRDADATLVLTVGAPTAGTALTVHYAQQQEIPCLLVNLDTPPTADEVCAWLAQKEVRVLNVAGPRESHCPGVYGRAYDFVADVLRTANSSGADDAVADSAPAAR